jgi:hypothetical protein
LIETLSIIVTTLTVFYERPVVSSISLLSIAVGVPIYYLWRPRRP